MTNKTPVKSRLEVNFIRLLEETQQIANGNKVKDWTFGKDERQLCVLYGSQTGTAEEVAERIGRESLRYYYKPVVLPMNEVSIEKLSKEKIAIFVASTTGQGDDPENMKDFFQSLWKCRNNKLLLTNLKYGVLGLGDSSYQKFNFSSKRLNKLLSIVGATPLVDIGLGDDQHDLGPDFVIDAWLKNLWNVLLDICPLPEGIFPLQDNFLLPPRYKIKYEENGSSKSDNIQYSNLSNVSIDDVHISQITSNVKKTSVNHFQDVRLIEFDVNSLNYRHKPGDVLMVQPQNLDEYVNEFLNVLNLDADLKFVLEPCNETTKLPSLHVLPQPCSIKQCVKSYFDIQSLPKRYFFELLSFFTTDENEKEKFLEFASAEGQQDFFDYCVRPKRSILEVLGDFPHTKCNIPFEYLFELIPPIKPRAYSIASSYLTFPGKVQILVAIVKYKTILKRPRLGLCTNWLARLNPGSEAPIWIKSGTLQFPKVSAHGTLPPIIMISAGTGCAPFRAYIQERIETGKTEDIVLIFGCRGKDKDYFFKEEWELLSQNGKLKLFCAFSRDQEDKVYIQHIMQNNYQYMWNYIGNNDAKIYYAGNAKRIPIDVYEALQYVCEHGSGMTPLEAEQYMKRNIEKRYQTESWA